MGSKYPQLNSKHIEFIQKQPLFFVATAPLEGRINLSPKGIDSLRVLSPNRVLWLNLTGSGNETAAHLLEDRRMTLMFCAFEGPPQILRLYGQASTIHPRHQPQWDEGVAHFNPGIKGGRQLIDLEVELVHSSCGFGVPLLNYQGERPTLTDWIERKGEAGIAQYWQDKNLLSMDGKPCGLLADPDPLQS